MTASIAPKTRRILLPAMILAGAGLAAACNSTTASPVSTTAPFACDIAVEEDGRMVNFQGRVQASEAISGSYNLHLSGRGTNIRQGGPFSARAGEIVTLGQSRLSGAPESFDAELSITVDGTEFSCPVSI